MPKFVQRKNGIWRCPVPECKYSNASLKNLRSHTDYRHKMHITVVPSLDTGRTQDMLAKDQTQQLNSGKIRKVFTLDTAIYRGRLGSRNPIVSCRKTLNASYGVFACTEFQKGDIVTVYSGIRVKKNPSSDEDYIRLKDHSYVIGIIEPVFGLGLGSLIKMHQESFNCKFHEEERSHLIVVIATKYIQPGNELFVKSI